MAVPKDPFILLSYINMKLRDEYDSPQELCSNLEIDYDWLVSTLKGAGFQYNPDTNQFR